MPDYLHRIDTSVLYAPFVERVKQVLDACAARGAIFVATSGLRTYEEQNALYAKGRTAPGGIVTNARGGQSNHNHGLAVDCTRHKGALPYPGKLDPDYNDAHYAILGEEAERCGLEWGGHWKSILDVPHIQVPLKQHGITQKKLCELYDKGGYPAVFKFLDDSFLW